MALARPSTNPHATDRNVGATRLIVLHNIAKHSPAGIRRRRLGPLVFGTDKAGGSSIAAACGWLRNAKLIESRASDDRTLVVTAAGRWALDYATEELLAGAEPPAPPDGENPYYTPPAPVIGGVGLYPVRNP